MSIVDTEGSTRRGDRFVEGGRVRARPQPLDDRSPITTADVGVVSWTVDPSSILWFLLATVAILVVLGSVLPSPVYAIWLGRESWAMDVIGQRFDLDGEGNFPSFFSAMQLLACGMLLAVIAARSWRVCNRWRFHWTVLAVGFVCMAVDEAAQLHELLLLPGLWFAGLMGIDDPSYAVWIPVALALLVPVALAFIPFVLALPVRIAVLMSAAGALFLGGAMGVETIGASVAAENPASIAYYRLVVIEAALEMAAISLFLFTLLLVLAMNVKARRFSIDITIRRP